MGTLRSVCGTIAYDQPSAHTTDGSRRQPVGSKLIVLRRWSRDVHRPGSVGYRWPGYKLPHPRPKGSQRCSSQTSRSLAIHGSQAVWDSSALIRFSNASTTRASSLCVA